MPLGCGKIYKYENMINDYWFIDIYNYKHRLHADWDFSQFSSSSNVRSSTFENKSMLKTMFIFCYDVIQCMKF